ncbi:hypothetical protein [Aeromonas sp. 1HA1]|uniref:hypothetical protein n=1 Tax=Aeromonas sp. 1HA1 TaxID=2699193 RepID=UPI0023DDA5F5|nr:hypothetical protein [Aeromonas sp. 1HA1]MDF2414520.1 hypothetical protein [Aeromonas sp. 1HA1]
MTFNECIYGGELWSILNTNILLIATLAIFGCSMQSTLTIRDVIKKQVNKKTWFTLIFFALTLLFSGTLLEGTIPDLLSRPCGNYAEVIIKFIIKIFDVLLLGILLLTTSFLIADRIVQGQRKHQEETQGNICHDALSRRDIIIIVSATAAITNISAWAVISIFMYFNYS